MPRPVIKQGHRDWVDLIGKRISFEWSDGYEDWHNAGILESIEGPYSEDPRYPYYYIRLEDQGGYKVWEDEGIEVRVYD